MPVSQSDSLLALRVRSLAKAFQQRTVFSGVDLDIARGEVVALTGANGSGKTTLLRCLTGRLRPDSGLIQCLGGRMGESWAARWIGMVAHDAQLYPCLTVQENLLFAARMSDLPHPAAVAGQWLDRAAVVPWADWPCGQLSRGLRQRVSIARAVLHEPPVVLLDEPFTGLDAEGRQWLDDLVRDVVKNDGTVCFTTHEQSDVSRLANRRLHVAGGKVYESKDRFETPLLRAAG